MRRALAGAAVLLGVLGVVQSEAAGPSKAKPLCLGKRATIVGSAGADDLRGTVRADVIAALGGADSVRSIAGNDLVCGGPGDDVLEAGAGVDRIDGGPGFDICRTAERRVACEETKPSARGVLGPGSYVTEVFKPRFTFETKGRYSVPHLLITVVELQRKADPAAMIVEFDSRNARRPVAEQIAKFTGLGGVTATTPVAASVGGAAGQRTDLTVGDTPVSITGLTAPSYDLEAGDRLRVYVVDVRGARVTILVEAPPGEVDAFFKEAEGLLGSVRWVT